MNGKHEYAFSDQWGTGTGPKGYGRMPSNFSGLQRIRENFVATYLPFVSIADQYIYQQLFLDGLDGLV
jgi:hypothetical protein